MAYNVPSYDTTKFSLGPAIVKIGAVGATPSTDLGAVSSVDFEITADGEDIMLGAPRQLVEVLPSQEEAQLTISLYEWDLNNFARAVGAGTTTSTVYRYGSGSVSRAKYSVLAQHRILGSGHTYEIRVWKAVPDGNFPVTMDDNLTEFEMVFRVLRSATNWRSETVNEYLEVAKIT